MNAPSAAGGTPRRRITIRLPGPPAPGDPLRRARVDVAQLARLICDAFDGEAHRRRLDFACDAPPELEAVVDAARLERILCNLLFNAFKYAPPGGTVRCLVTLDAGGERVVLSVSGTGMSVPDDKLAAMFTGDHGLDRSVVLEGGGTGLSLGSSRRYAEMHGGSLTVRAGPYGGPSFEVTLPRHAAQDEAGEETPPLIGNLARGVAARASEELQRDELARAPKGGGKPVVLIVDDNRTLVSMVQDSLGADYHTVSADDGEQGLLLARDTHPDLVITDVVMHGLAGPALVAAIRHEPGIEDTPILVLTVSDDADLRVQMLEQGVQDFVTKPFLLSELRARVRNLVSAKRARDVLSAEVADKQADLVQLANQVVRHQRELETTLEQMAVARQVAERASLAKSNFLRIMSHELRTPLTALQLYIRMLETSGIFDNNDKARLSVDRIKRSYQRLLQLVENVVAYARLESGRLALNPEAFDLGATADKVVQELRPFGEQKGLPVTYAGPNAPTNVLSDIALVRLCLMNVIGYVIDSSQGGRVDVQLSSSQPCLTVQNLRLFLSKEEQIDLFEPFGQPKDLRRQAGFGSGLGLAIVHEIVSALGGHITVASAAASGTTFSLTIPNREETYQLVDGPTDEIPTPENETEDEAEDL